MITIHGFKKRRAVSARAAVLFWRPRTDRTAGPSCPYMSDIPEEISHAQLLGLLRPVVTSHHRVRQLRRRRWRYPKWRAPRPRPRHGHAALQRVVLRRIVRVLPRQLHRVVQLIAMRDGLFRGRLRAHLSALGRLQAGLLGRELPDLVRGRHLHRRVLVGSLQHFVPERRHVQRLLLERRMQPWVRAGRDVLLHELLVGRVLLYGARLSLTNAVTWRGDASSREESLVGTPPSRSTSDRAPPTLQIGRRCSPDGRPPNAALNGDYVTSAAACSPQTPRKTFSLGGVAASRAWAFRLKHRTCTSERSMLT